MRLIAALYIDRGGPYPRMPGVDAWDVARDARKYEGPYPVVAHPPCGPWSKLARLSTLQDPSCGPRAVQQVRDFGGVLEHPAYSKLWDHCGMPKPYLFGIATGKDEYGGFSIFVTQVSWGHCCMKPTWLYFVGVPKLEVALSVRDGGTPTRCIKVDNAGPRKLPSANDRQRRRTPPAFAEWLVSLARKVRR